MNMVLRKNFRYIRLQVHTYTKDTNARTHNVTRYTYPMAIAFYAHTHTQDLQLPAFTRPTALYTYPHCLYFPTYTLPTTGESTIAYMCNTYKSLRSGNGIKSWENVLVPRHKEDIDRLEVDRNTQWPLLQLRRMGRGGLHKHDNESDDQPCSGCISL